MTPRFVFRAELEADLAEARDWYEAQSPGLGLEFLRAFEAALAQVGRAPLLYPVVEGETRRALLRRFPYQLVYRVRGEEIVIAACLHHRRDPARWRSRTDV